jgi:hypothetical protein
MTELDNMSVSDVLRANRALDAWLEAEAALEEGDR